MRRNRENNQPREAYRYRPLTSLPVRQIIKIERYSAVLYLPVPNSSYFVTLNIARFLAIISNLRNMHATISSPKDRATYFGKCQVYGARKTNEDFP